MRCADENEVMRWYAGKLGDERTIALESHFEDCQTCGALRDEVAEMTARLAPDPDELDDPSFADDVMTLVRMGRAKEAAAKPSIFRSWQGWLLIPVTALATAIGMFILVPQLNDTNGIQVRSGADSLDRWVSLQTFQLRGDDFQPVEHEITSDAPLAFSYRNRSEELHYLMVFAIDANTNVFWYFPDNADAHANPVSIPIVQKDESVTLPDQVSHNLEAGPLRLFAIFSAVPLDVQSIERQLQGMSIDQSRLEIDDVGQHSILLQVVGAGDN